MFISDYSVTISGLWHFDKPGSQVSVIFYVMFPLFHLSPRHPIKNCQIYKANEIYWLAIKTTCDELPQVPVRIFIINIVLFNSVKIPTVTESLDHPNNGLLMN
jgi:hypothetical protein